MLRHRLHPLWVIVFLCIAVLFAFCFWPSQPVASAGFDQTSGSLGIVGKDGSVAGACPLRHTEVRGAISGFLARVTVTQTFENTASEKIEAIYAFPLPDNAAVDDMTIQVGQRTVRGVIKKREDARAIYEQAKQSGHVAALLDQERPNIFTQAVANIMPADQVVVTISYLQTLEYEDGTYEFVFPMVVGPRFIPGQPAGKQAGGWAPDTDQVPDASKITPQVTPKGTRAGHDISIELAIDSGVPLQQVNSSSHQIDVVRTNASAATVKLANLAEIPNKDFILKYNVSADQIADSILSQSAPLNSAVGPGGYFTLILQPPAKLPESDITPKELVFVLDTSGSMMGFPIEKAKEFINHALDELYPGDTFNLITFSGDTRVLFPTPVYPTAENLRIAREVLNAQHGGGGTVMMNAIRAALAPSDSQDHVRVVCFLTDGFVGNDLDIIAEVQKHANARVFAFGIGNSVNRFLIEGMARAGRGESEVVTLNDKADVAAHRLYERLRSPVLTDVSIDWGGLPVTDVFPKNPPDLFSARPLVVSGRYTAATAGTIHIRGQRAGESFARDIPVTFTSDATSSNILSRFWARRKIDDLMSQDLAGLQSGNMKPEVKQEITQLGLSYRLMTQFTSFVAVEERVVTTGGQPHRVEVPVEMPDGVSYEGVFGDQASQTNGGLATYGYSMSVPRANAHVTLKMAAPSSTIVAHSGGGAGGGYAVNAAPAPGSAGGVATLGGPAYGVAPPPPPPSAAPGAIATVNELSSADQGVSNSKPSVERALLESKFSPALLNAFDCWKKEGTNCKQLKDGAIQLQLFLTGDAANALQLLKGLGFVVSDQRPKQKSVLGHLPAGKLAELARLESVRFVTLVN
jgi:Ca-activated chloride channel family protein